MALERKLLAHYIDANMSTPTLGKNYVRIGKGMEEYTEELNQEVEIKHTLTGRPYVLVGKYQAQSQAPKYYADENDFLFAPLFRIANERLNDDSCKTTRVDVLYGEDGHQIWAYREDCFLIPSSVGGNTDGVQIPFTVYSAGNRVYGTWDDEHKRFDDGEPPDPGEVVVGALNVTPTLENQTIFPASHQLTYFNQVNVAGIPVTRTPNAAGGITVAIG